MSKKLHLVFWLVALLALAACQRETVDINPTYNPTDNTVLAKFVFNVNTSSGPENYVTKMTGDAVQYTNKFRGMDAVHILAYKVDYGDHVWKPATSTAMKDFNLGTMIGSDGDPSSSRIVELAVPLETNVLALYGKATKTAGADDAEGIVDLTYSPATAFEDTPNHILFKLKDRLEDEEAFNQFSKLVGAMLTGFFRTGLVHETVADGYKSDKDYSYSFWYPVDATSDAWATRSDGTKTKYGGTGTPIAADGAANTGDANYKFHTGTKSWREYGQQYAINKGYIAGTYKAMKPLEEVLGQAYAEFCTIKTSGAGGTGNKELRAGCSGSLIRTIADLALVIDKVAKSIPTDYEEEIAILLATELQIRINRYFELGTAGDWSTLKFKSWLGDSGMANMVKLFMPDEYNPETAFPKITDAFFADETGFPINLHLPMGAAILTVDTKAVNGKNIEEFSYLKEIPAYGMGTTDYKMPIVNYRYPPELMYYANSPIRVSTKNDNVTYPVTVEAWDTAASWDAATWSAEGATVLSTTRSIAMTKHVNYGNALLQTKVKYADGIDGLHDNNSILHPGESDNVIDYTSGGKLKITGLMIGGQPDFVGWDFTHVSDADVTAALAATHPEITTNPFDKLIYDHQITPVDVPASGETGIMYTLCWDNFDLGAYTAGTAQGVVYVALELVNETGRDFWGELNLIRKGGTFYLVGKLDLNDATAGAVTNIPATLARTNYYYPPFDASGNTIEAPRIFMQDYATTATLVLGQNSLRHAYVTVPDLRGSQVSLGLSVDLKWEPGITFTNVLMGGN